MADYRKEFPDFPEGEMPAMPTTFEDASHHNDACPCLISPVLQLVLWVEYPDPERREVVDSKRYTLVAQDMDEEGVFTADVGDTLLETDEWPIMSAFVEDMARCAAQPHP